MSAERSSARRERLVAFEGDQSGGLDAWVAELRRVCLDNLEKSSLEGRRATLRDRLLPLSSRYAPKLRDVLYSESVWAAGTLAVCFLSFALFTGSSLGALAFTLVASLLILPLLALWTGLGYYYVRKGNRNPQD